MELYKEVEKIFPLIEEAFTEGLLEFKNTRISDLYIYNFGIGTWIRNNFLYPKGSILYNLFLENGIEHPDDMSSYIIKLFHCYLAKKV